MDSRLRVAYTWLDTEVLSVDNVADPRACAVRRGRSADPPAAQSGLGGDHVVVRARRTRSSRSNGRGAMTDLEPNFASSVYRNPGYAVVTVGGAIRVAHESRGLRPRDEPLRPRLRGSARLPGARADGAWSGVRVAIRSLTSDSATAMPRADRAMAALGPRRACRSTSPPATSSASSARTDPARRRCCGCWRARCAPAVRPGAARRRRDRALPRARARAADRRGAAGNVARPSTTRALEIVLMGRYPHLGAFEIEGPADLRRGDARRSRRPARPRSPTARSARSAAARSSAS